MDNAYLDWLKDRFIDEKKRWIGREDVFDALADIEFEPFGKNDINRVHDVKTYLREKYAEDTPHTTGIIRENWIESESVSVLEVLMALSMRFANDVGGVTWEQIFFDAIANMGLMARKYAGMHSPSNRDEIYRIIGCFVNRLYDESNMWVGCAWPSSKKDKMIYEGPWDQLSIYWSEKLAWGDFGGELFSYISL